MDRNRKVVRLCILEIYYGYGAGYDAYIDTDTVAGVNIIFNEFISKGVLIVSEPKNTDYGSYEFVIQDIDGRLIGYRSDLQ